MNHTFIKSAFYIRLAYTPLIQMFYLRLLNYVYFIYVPFFL